MYENGQTDIPAQAAGPMPTAARESIAGARSADIKPSFLAELARAMQATAERERGRIAEVVADDAAENVERTRTRADAETKAKSEADAANDILRRSEQHRFGDARISARA